jgi:hypothetical protein
MKLEAWLKSLSNDHRRYAKRILALGFDAPVPKGVSQHWATVIRYHLIDVIFDGDDNNCYVNKITDMISRDLNNNTSDKIYSVNPNGCGQLLNQYLKKKLRGKGFTWNCKRLILPNLNLKSFQEDHPLPRTIIRLTKLPSKKSIKTYRNYSADVLRKSLLFPTRTW